MLRAAVDEPSMPFIADARWAALADAVLALTTKAQLDMRERCAALCDENEQGGHVDDVVIDAIRALAPRDVTP
jgi:hypothetical protein